MGKKEDKIVKEFVRIVEKNISPCTIILFGSRVTGKIHKDSDYDFLVISPYFHKMEWEKRGMKLYQLKQNIPAPMDIICLTPEEFDQKKKEMGIVQEAAREGVVVSG